VSVVALDLISRFVAHGAPDAVVAPLVAYRVLLERWFGLQSWPDAPGITR
jgi:hypothetical protein